MSTSTPASARAGGRLLLYTLLNVAFTLLVLIGASVSGAGDPRFLYLCVLFALCSTLVFSLDAINGRYAMLGCFLLVYFVFFGVQDLVAVLAGHPAVAPESGLLTATEAVILVGLLMLIVGYYRGLALARRVRVGSSAKDWPESIVLSAGTALFIIGTAATWYLYVFVMPDKNVYAGHRLAQLDPKLTAVLLAGNLMLPLGIAVLAYAYAAFRRRYMGLIILAVVVLQGVTGFVTDVKADAMKGALIVLLAKVLIGGKLPVGWLAGGVLFLVFGFPVLQAYRSEVIGQAGMNHIQVVRHLGSALQTAISAADRIMKSKGETHEKNFIERASMKASVELTVENSGRTSDYQYGRTLAPMLGVFIPRLVMPDKTDVQAGRVYGAEFHASTFTDTYISPSHIGEMYWNFGFPGVVVGMFLLGLLLGFIGGKCDFTEYVSVTRLLIFANTAHLLVWGFEQTIATNYVVWLRTMVVIGGLHLVLSRVPAQKGSKQGPPPDAKPLPQISAFPNLLR
jgi:hypothetical protein